MAKATDVTAAHKDVDGESIAVYSDISIDDDCAEPGVISGVSTGSGPDGEEGVEVGVSVGVVVVVEGTDAAE